MATAVLAGIGGLQRGWEAALAALPEPRWLEPSQCPGWSQKALVAHVIQLAEFAVDSIERGLGGDGGPPPGADSVADWRAARTARLGRMRDLPAAELLAQLRDRFGRLQPLLDAAASRPDRPAWHSTGTHTTGWWLDHYLFELAIHDWDRRAPSEPEAELAGGAIPALGPALFARLPRWFGRAPASVPDGVVTVRCGGDSPLEPVVRLAAGAASVEPPGGAPDATVETDTGAFGLVMTARRPFGRFADRGRWRIAGDRRLGEAFSAGFKPV